MIMTKDDLEPVIEGENQQNQNLDAEVKADAEELVHDTIQREAKESDAIPRKYVTEIVDRAREKAFQKGKLKGMEELKAQLAAEQAQSQSQPIQAAPQSVGLGGMNAPTAEQIAQMVADAAQKLEEKRQRDGMLESQKLQAHSIANNFNSQMLNGKAKYADFDKKLESLDIAGMSQLIPIIAETGKADDIMYDLVDNPQKITHLMILAHTQPKLAQREIAKLIASIQQNQEAVKQVSPRDPLDSLTPSTIGTDSSDMSSMSVNDFRKMFI